MSSNIEIIQEEDRGVEVVVKTNSIQLQTYEYYSKCTEFIFDMTNESHRQAVKNLVEVLQHQLQIHEAK